MADKVPGVPASKKKTAKVPASAASPGGTPYHQAKLGKGFIAVPPKSGHKQRGNIK
jgi:hypothetical protein